MARKKRGELETETVALRLTKAQVKLIDEDIERQQALAPGCAVSRSSVLRMALMAWVKDNAK